MAYRGLSVPVYVGTVGMYGGKDLANAPANALVNAENVQYDGRAVRKEAGTARYNSNTLGATTVIMGGIDWAPSGTNQSSIIFTGSGSVLSDNNGTATYGVTVVAGLTATGVVPHFVAAGHEEPGSPGKLFLFTGANPVRMMTGDATSMPTLATSPGDWSTVQPAWGVLHENRMWAGAGRRVYYSAPTSHDHFATANSGSINVFPGDPGDLVAGISFKGKLVCFGNPRGVYAIDTTDVSTTGWRVDKISNEVGTINAKSMVQVADDVLFVDRSGTVHLLSGTSEYGDLKSSAISDLNMMTQWIRDNIARGELKDVRVAYYEDRREAHIAMPASGATVNNRRIVIDFNDFPNVRFRVSSRDTVSSFWIREGSDNIEKLMYGSNDGFVRTMDQDSFQHDNGGYTGSFETFRTDFSHLDQKLAGTQKNGDFLEVTSEVLGNFPFLVDIFWDGSLKQTVTINPGVGTNVLGSFVLGVDRLGRKGWETQRKRVVGAGRTFAVRVRQSADQHGFSISDMRLYFNAGALESR